MHTERDDSGQYSPIHANIACIGEPVSKDDSQLSFEADGPAFLTQDERAAMSDVSVRTQATSDIYEKAGLGPEIRSGAISGAEAERRARDPDAPKPLILPWLSWRKQRKQRKMMLNPWDRREGETPRAFAAFCLYRDLPAVDRSIVAAVAQHRQNGGKASVRNWETWSSLYNWSERSLAGDSDLASRRRIRRGEALERAQDDIANMSRAALAKLLPLLQPTDAGGLDPYQIPGVRGQGCAYGQGRRPGQGGHQNSARLPALERSMG